MSRFNLPRDARAGIVRRVIFTPYRKGAGPTFALTLYDPPARLNESYYGLAGSRLGYVLRMRGSWDGSRPHSVKVLFHGTDFRPSPMHCTDSDDTVRALMDFLTLRPGDTDREYFARYTPTQMRFCDEHAEALAAEVYGRFPCGDLG